MTQSISDTNPNGFCKQCGFHLQNSGKGGKTCVNCDIKSEPSGVVNSIEDPGHEAVVKSLAGIGVKSGQVKEVPLKDTAIKSQDVKKSYATYEFDPYVTLTLLKNHFESMAVKDLKQAKSLLKLRKEIDELANKIKTFLGE